MLQTRTLSKRYSADEFAKLCRRRNLASETPYRILQMCPSVLEPRRARHNFISKTIIKKHRKHADISSKSFFVTRDGVRLRPDVVLCPKNKTFISLPGMQEWRFHLFPCGHVRGKVAEIPPSGAGDLCEMSGKGVVAAVTMSYRGTWARESVNILTDVGLGRNDFKVMSILMHAGWPEGLQRPPEIDGGATPSILAVTKGLALDRYLQYPSVDKQRSSGFGFLCPLIVVI
ncbi:hypothetical protein MRX96_017955 [Rhipicephalus microplus]